MMARAAGLVSAFGKAGGCYWHHRHYWHGVFPSIRELLALMASLRYVTKIRFYLSIYLRGEGDGSGAR